MNLLDLAHAHPLLAGFVVLVVFHYCARLIHLPFRAAIVLRHGWPPGHCDADGDYHRPRCADCEE